MAVCLRREGDGCRWGGEILLLKKSMGTDIENIVSN